MTLYLKKIGIYLKAFQHLFYPHICLQCGFDELNHKQIICDVCESQLPFTHFEQFNNNPIEKIFWGRMPIRSAFSLLYFTKGSIVQEIFFEFKYHQNKSAGYQLGKLIANALIQNTNWKEIDYLVPIPISKKKLKKRGFNQSQIICEAIVENGISIPIYNGLETSKTKDTISQTKKDRVERALSYQSPFSINNKNVLTGKHLLLVDDIITTGATLDAASNCLLSAGPASIQVVTAAYTYHS